MQITLWKAVHGSGVSVQLPDFDPIGGYEAFLKKLCSVWGESLIDWYQGIESGIGHVSYRGFVMTVAWNDFPFALAFDCPDQLVAEKFKQEIEIFFVENPEPKRE